MKVYNSTEKDILISTGVYSNPHSWVVGTLEKGKNSEIPIEKGDFLNIQEVY